MADRPNLTQLLELVKKMQQLQENLQQELGKIQIQGQVSGGLVTVTLNGHYEANFTITEQALNEGQAVLEDLIAAATQDAARQVDSTLESKTQTLTQELPKELQMSAALGAPGLTNEVQQMTQKLQGNMLQTREELAKLEVVGNAGGGLVTITMNGRHEIKVALKDEAIKDALQEGNAILEELVSAAFNDAVRKLREQSQHRAYDLVKGLNPLFNMKPSDEE